ncbi:hypothetical protein J7J00_17690 [Bacillus sp. ISL-4]|uniref:hypothetical protein n=1 Tax=Bacillus sp. ISL-4 TaxID=2819125 RepID=UPI001BE4F3EA|nr:hypothetical protein [Bacillus sp. ISL-4]MBT2667315.1 hypothetical protein [Bacillus sp. ISL-4]MBT2674191.1 hypothetical protein [Streptomyces sp. ISL-14]
MALQAETLVEEWFNRNGYFTIRGIKDKIDEIDILAIKNLGQYGWDCVHCEVQVSIRPVAYISKLTSQLVIELGVKTSTSAKLRTEPHIETCAKQWVSKKFLAPKKQQLREQLNPNSSWRYLFVHGNVKDPKELAYIASEGVELKSFRQILSDLCTKQTQLDFAGSSAGDLVEIINFIQN